VEKKIFRKKIIKKKYLYPFTKQVIKRPQTSLKTKFKGAELTCFDEPKLHLLYLLKRKKPKETY
jgi:hypothetical protein